MFAQTYPDDTKHHYSPCDQDTPFELDSTNLWSDQVTPAVYYMCQSTWNGPFRFVGKIECIELTAKIARQHATEEDLKGADFPAKFTMTLRMTEDDRMVIRVGHNTNLHHAFTAAKPVVAVGDLVVIQDLDRHYPDKSKPDFFDYSRRSSIFHFEAEAIPCWEDVVKFNVAINRIAFPL